ncbi:MAG TPA: hypothetical protein VG942_09850, partial [Hyphomonadaceae bacterium]|nr:hypothetical protein [Hyphomonadaceae bacterium]
MRGIRFPVLAAAVLALASAPVRAQDVFSSGDRCKPAGLGDDPSVCGDSQRIAQTEAQTGSVARVFDGYASQSPQGELGRYLETHGYTAHSGSCLKQPSRVVLFVLNGKVCEANRVGDAFAASDNPNPGGASGGGGQSRPVPIPTPVPGPGPRYIPGPSPNASFGQPKVAGADPCRPFGKGGYDFCQNPKGTRLPAGCSCSNGGGPSNDPGGKGIIVDRKRDRDPPTLMKNPPSDGALFNAINDCLSFIPLNKREFYYYDRPPIQARARKHPGDPPVNYQYGVIYYDQDFMAQQTPATRATLYADAFARHAQALHDKRFGRPED